MKLLNDNNGYISSILAVLLLIPVMLLLIITVEQDNYYVNKTADNIQSNRLDSITTDFQNEIDIATKEVMHNVTLSVIKDNKPLLDSKDTVLKLINNKITQKEIEYKNNTGCNVNCDIISVNPSGNDPFQIEVSYTLNSYFNQNNSINRNKNVNIDLTDSNYPVYDTLIFLKTNARFATDVVNYEDNLVKILTLNNSNAYENAIEGCVIKRCPYEDYTTHANSNVTFLNCISNHYYHESHDGLCIFCRLENQTSCSDYGIETFIIPTQLQAEAPASIDHVLLNTSIDGAYMGKQYLFDNNTFLYLDNGHKSKYGL